MKNIIKAFRYRGQTFETTRINLTSFYMSKMKQLLGDCIITKNNNKTITVDNNGTIFHKKYSINTWNDEIIKLYDSICDIPKYYNQYLKNNKEYMFTDNHMVQTDGFNAAAKPVETSSKNNKLSLNILD